MSLKNLSEHEITIIKRKICIQYMWSIITVLILFTLYYFYAGIKPLNYFVGAVLVSHILFLYILYVLDYESLQPLIPFYFVFISVFLYVEILFFWHFGQITILFWYSIIPIAAMIFFEKKNVLFWSGFVFILLCSIFIVTPFIPEEFFSQLTKSQLIGINIVTIISTIGFILFFVYHQFKINQKKELLFNPYEVKEKNYAGAEENIILDNLYFEILSYFSEKKPYCNPDFSIIQLAKDLNSNVKDISEAIKIKEHVDFIFFLNKYRINLVKEMISNNYHNKYTLRYIYTQVGFRHQPIFNRVFKEIEGITPSEYIKNQQGFMKYFNADKYVG